MIVPPPSVQNVPLWQEHCRQVCALAQRIINNEVGVIDGSRQMSKFENWLHAGDSGDFLIFIGVDSESHHLPVGDERKHWDPAILRMKDLEISELENFYRKNVIAAALHIQTKYQ